MGLTTVAEGVENIEVADLLIPDWALTPARVITGQPHSYRNSFSHGSGNGQGVASGFRAPTQGRGNFEGRPEPRVIRVLGPK